MPGEILSLTFQLGCFAPSNQSLPDWPPLTAAAGSPALVPLAPASAGSDPIQRANASTRSRKVPSMSPPPVRVATDFGDDSEQRRGQRSIIGTESQIHFYQ